MTVQEAIYEVQKVGTIRAENGKLKLRFPEAERARLEPAVETLRRDRETALRSLRSESKPSDIPPSEWWPESLRDLAHERAALSNDPETARKEVWISWYEWKACELNRLFQERGTTGEPGRITAATVRHGERNARREG